VVHKEAGILARSVSDIFDRIKAVFFHDYEIKKNMDKAQYQVTCSFMEIYMENLTDLLIEKKIEGQSIQIREDPQKGIYIEGLTEKVYFILSKQNRK